MNPLYPIVIIVSIALFGFGLIQQQITVPASPESNNDPVASDTATPVQDTSPTVKQPTTTPTPIHLSPTPTKSTQANTSISSFVYPNSTISEQTSTSFRLTSSDIPETITNWYKEKIVEKHMQINTFVTTSSNDNILNKLGGAGNEMNILITIERKPSNSTTTIVGKLDAPSSSIEVNVHNEMVN